MVNAHELARGLKKFAEKFHITEIKELTTHGTFTEQLIDIALKREFNKLIIAELIKIIEPSAFFKSKNTTKLILSPNETRLLGLESDFEINPADTDKVVAVLRQFGLEVDDLGIMVDFRRLITVRWHF